jgi:hypothetical protein
MSFRIISNEKSFLSSLLLIVFLAVGLMVAPSANAATTPSLGTAGTFGVLSSTFTNSNTSPLTNITGDIGYTVAGAPTTPPLFHTGTVHPENATHAQAGLDQGTALGILNGQACTTITGPLDATIIGSNAPGTFPPGCYTMANTMNITLGTSVTLDLTAPDGDGGNTWIFKSTGGGLTTGADSFVTLANGASACNVFWAPVAATNIGAYTGALPNTTKLFVGTIISDAGISLGHFANLSGRALAFGGTVTTDANTITAPSCATPPPPQQTQALTCNPATQSVAIGQTAQFTAGGGTGTYSWAAPGGSPSAGNTNAFNASYATSGTKTVTLTSGGQTVTCTVFVAPAPIPPLINVVKVPTPLALPGGPGLVTYDYTVSNVGEVAMSNVTLTDDKCAPVNRISGDTNSNNLLDTNETWKYRCATTLATTTTNTAIVTGQANGLTATDVATARVVVGSPLPPPLINVVKKPNPLALPFGGGSVTYTYTVTNPGTVALSNVSVTDNKCSPLSGSSGDSNGNNMLDTNETWTYTCAMNLTTTTTNTATALGSANNLTAVDLALATVTVAPPKLPSTGIGPDEKNVSWQISAGILMLVSILFVFTQRKRTI